MAKIDEMHLTLCGGKPCTYCYFIGVKAFTKCENKGARCDFRLAQEGALMTIPFMTKRIVKPTLKDLEVLLLCNDVDMPPEHTELDEATRAQINEIDTGSVALVYEENRGDYMIKLEFVGKRDVLFSCYFP